MQTLHGEELKARRTVTKLEDSPVATFRDCSCNISLFTATILQYLAAGFPVRNMMYIAVVALLVTTSSF